MPVLRASERTFARGSGAAANTTATAVADEAPTNIVKNKSRKADPATATHNTRQKQTRSDEINIADETTTQSTAIERNDEVVPFLQTIEPQLCETKTVEKQTHIPANLYYNRTL